MTKSRIKKSAVYLLLTVLMLTSCMKLRTSDSKTYRKFKKKGIEVSIKRALYGDTSIRYVKSGSIDQTKPLIVFVHGAPGSSDSFYHFLMDSSFGERAQMLSIDRLGYGYSRFGKAETDIAKQAAVLKEVIAQETFSRLILVGHSYGGPIICQYAIENKKEAMALLLLAPVLDPSNEKIFKVSYFGKWKVTRFLTPRALRVATDEKFAHATALQEIAGGYGDIICKVVHIHGDKDPIAPYVNLTYAQAVFSKEHFVGITLLGKNHFLPWNSKAEIDKYLHGLLNVQ